ncbi:ladderlectin-like [Melanotaenia boesemani]|uniref:ladderlectin-like n=1 Tax=Melanotaenia boesemani TaxID=1250792 RepID=UPI001C058160|nr:ladderlectin-like [Melanotaenia boesemani]
MLLLFFLFGLALGAESPPADQEVKLLRGGCPVFWYSFNGRCYKYVATLMTWADAELHCVSQGANLVSIHSQKEEDFVKLLIKNFDPAQGVNWIGLTDAQQEGAWFWSDGSKVNFKFWNKGQPNNYGGHEKCGHTNWDTSKGWNDAKCSDRSSFVCASRTACA